MRPKSSPKGRSVFEGFVAPKGISSRFRRAIGTRAMLLSNNVIRITDPVTKSFIDYKNIHADLSILIEDTCAAFYEYDDKSKSPILTESPEVFGYEVEPEGKFAAHGSLLVPKAQDWPKMDGDSTTEKRLNAYITWIAVARENIPSDECLSYAKQIAGLTSPTSEGIAMILAPLFQSEAGELARSKVNYQDCIAGCLALALFSN